MRRQFAAGSVEAAVKHLQAAFARIWTLNENANVLELQASAGLYTHLDGAHSRIPVGKFKIGKIAGERIPHLSNSVIGDPRAMSWARPRSTPWLRLRTGSRCVFCGSTKRRNS